MDCPHPKALSEIAGFGGWGEFSILVQWVKCRLKFGRGTLSMVGKNSQSHFYSPDAQCWLTECFFQRLSIQLNVNSLFCTGVRSLLNFVLLWMSTIFLPLGLLGCDPKVNFFRFIQWRDFFFMFDVSHCSWDRKKLIWALY